MKEIKLKVNSINPNSMNYISDYLVSLGIDRKHVDSYITGPKPGDEDDYNLLDNIDEGLEMVHDYMENGGTVYLQPDSDTDGLTSAAIFYSYFKHRYPLNEIKWKLHPGKEHGITVSDVPPDCGLVVIPDAGSMQSVEQLELSRMGKKVIILDHHDLNEYTRYNNVIIVNNQYSKRFTNKELSGAGMVYEFIHAYDDKYYTDAEQIHTDYLDLAALGIIADMMNTATLGNNYIISNGLSHINNKAFQELLIKQSYSIKDISHPNKIDIAFYIAPLINGLIRSGELSEKETLFNAMIDNENYRTIKTTWRGAEREETIYQYAARIAANAKSRQDAAKKKSFEWLCDKIRSEGLDKHNIIIVTLDEKESSKVSPNITGLIAMELVKEFNRPALVMRTTELNSEKVYGGSGRGGNFYCMPDLKAELNKANVLYAEGHANAFGVFMRANQVDDIRKYFDEHFDSKVFDDVVFEVDYYFHDERNLNLKMLKEFGLMNNLYGAGIPQPKFAFDLEINPNDIMIMGKDSSSVKIKKGRIDFVAFKNRELIDALQANAGKILTCVGRSQINEYMGYQNVQIILDDTEVKEKIDQPVEKPMFKSWF